MNPGVCVLELLIREECHLCSAALEALAQCGQQPRLLDIDDDLELGLRYGLRIPVLRASDGAELDWPFAAEQLKPWIEAHG